MAWISLIGAGLGAAGSSSAGNAQASGGKKALKAQQQQFNTTQANFAPYRQAGYAALSRLQDLLGVASAPSMPTMDQFTHKVKSKQGFNPNDPLHIFGKGSSSAPLDPLYAKLTGQSILPSKPGTKFDAAGYQNAVAKYKSDLEKFNKEKTNPEYGSLLRNFSSSDLAKDPVYNSGLQFGMDQGTRAINSRAAAGGGYDSGATLKALTRFGNDYASTKAGEAYNRFNINNENIYNRLSGLAGTGQNANNTIAGVGANTADNLSNIYQGMGNAQGAASIAGANSATGALNNYNSNQMLQQLMNGGSARGESGLTQMYDPNNQQSNYAGYGTR